MLGGFGLVCVLQSVTPAIATAIANFFAPGCRLLNTWLAAIFAPAFITLPYTMPALAARELVLLRPGRRVQSAATAQRAARADARRPVRLACGVTTSVAAVVVRRRRRRIFESQHGISKAKESYREGYLRRPPPRRPRERPDDDSTGTAGAGPRAIIADHS